MGSGSSGHGRIWRYMHSEERYAHMQAEAIEIWRDIEKAAGQPILTEGGLLYIKSPNSPDFEELCKYGERLNAKQIKERWPALQIPDYLEGSYTKTGAGVTKVKVALDTF